MSDTRIINNRRNNPRNARILPIATVETNKIVETTVNVFTNANELLDYREAFIHDYCEEESIRCATLKVRCLDDTEATIAIFTVENGSYYSAIEVDGEWVEFTILDSTKSKDTIRFNTRTHQHFYADEWTLNECGDTPLSKMILGMMTNRNHIGDCVVYNAIELAKKQGLI